MRFAIVAVLVATSFLPAIGRTEEISGSVGAFGPLVVHGSNVDFDGDLKFVFSAQAAYKYRIASYPSLSIGLWGNVGLLYLDNALDSNLKIYALGPNITWETQVKTDVFWEVVMGLGIQRLDIVVDENIRKSTYALGALWGTGLKYLHTPNWGLGVVFQYEHYTSPLNDPIWFNQPLGRTSLLRLGLEIAHRWGL